MVGTNMRYLFCDDRTSSLSETMKIGAFAERKKKMFEEPRLDLDMPFCSFFADRISLDESKTEGESQNLAPSPENDRLSGNAAEDNEEQQTAAQQKTDSAKNEKNGNLPAQPEVSMVSTGDDFIMVDLKTPFAKPPADQVEMHKVLSDWQNAVPLQTFKELHPVEATDLQKQLETFESDLCEFDNLMEKLCQSSPNNN